MANVLQRHTSKTMLIGKEDLDKFQTLEDRRRIRAGMVNNILTSLRRGIHWGQPLTVNYREGIYRIKDGNHRFEAVKRYLEENPEADIELNMNLFTGLTDEEENEEYDKIQNITKESAADFLQIHCKEIPLFAMLTHKTFVYPITSYGGATSFPFKNLVDAYLGAVICNNAIAFNANNTRRLAMYKQLQNKDAAFMYDFMTGFIATLGVPRMGKNGNKWAKTTPFTALMRLYYDNIATHGETAFWRDISNKVMTNPYVLESMQNGGVIAQLQTHSKMLEAMNWGKKTKHYVLSRKSDKADKVEADEELD